MLGVKQTLSRHFTSSDLKVIVSQLNVILTSLSCQLCVKSNSHISHPLLRLCKNQCNFHSNSVPTCTAMYPDLYRYSVSKSELWFYESWFYREKKWQMASFLWQMVPFCCRTTFNPILHGKCCICIYGK